MAGNNSALLKFALVGGAAYLAWRQGWLDSFLPASVAANPVTPAAVPVIPAAPDPNAIQGQNTLAGIYGRLVTAAKAPAAGLAADEWDFYLNPLLSPLGKVAPDPMEVFPAAVPGFDRSQKLSAGQYWSVVGPALRAQGLSGLGFFGGMGLYGVIQ